MTLFDDLGDNPSHLLKDSPLRFFKRLIDVGNAFIAVLLTSSISKPSRFPKFSGSSSIFEQLDKMRIFRDIKLQYALGKLERFLQSLRSNLIRPVTNSTDNDRSFIGVSFK